MTNKSVAQICAIAAVVIMPSLSWAGTTSKTVASKATAPAPEKLNESFITGDLGLNVVSAYYFHGVLENNHSPSFQPYADIFLKAYEGDGALNKVVFGLGVWESYNTDAKYKHVGNNSAWFEHDVTPSVALSFGKVTITETYQFFSSPNSQFTDSQALNSKLSFDDADLLGAFALHPSVSLTHELDGKQAIDTSVAANARFVAKHGNYWEAAVAPSYSAGPVTVTLPVVMAFGTESYYQKNGYAFTSVGLNVAYTLPVSKSYGTWTANAGATYYTLDSKVVGNGTSANRDVVAQGGLGVAF
jgi:hypothetical protein